MIQWVLIVVASLFPNNINEATTFPSLTACERAAQEKIKEGFDPKLVSCKPKEAK